MRKAIITLFLLTLTALPLLVTAQGSLLKPGKEAEYNSNLQKLASSTDYSTEDSLEMIIGRIVRTILTVLGTVFLILMFLAGNLWMRASGNQERVDKAKKQIKSLLIGLAIIIAAYALSSWIIGALVGSSGSLVN